MHSDDFIEDGKLMTVKKLFEVVDGNVSPTRIYFSQERSSLPPQQPISAMTEQQTLEKLLGAAKFKLSNVCICESYIKLNCPMWD